jgi:hypothetical protein
MGFNQQASFRLGWRSLVAVVLFFCAFSGLSLGVSLSERVDVVNAGIFTKAYYSVGLFVMGGLDIGMPIGGPDYARVLMWIAYIGSPFIAASALLEALFHAFAPKHWQLRRIKNHIIIVGTTDLTVSYLKVYVKNILAYLLWWLIIHLIGLKKKSLNSCLRSIF